MNSSDQHLVSIIPEIKYRRFTYTMSEGDIPPYEGLFLVSIGKNRKVNSVYQVVSYRKIVSKKYPHRYEIVVLKTPDMIPFAKCTGFRFYTTVKGIPALPIFWNSRKKR